MIKCEICNKEFENLRNLSNHIRIHNISVKGYYDKYLKKDINEGKCQTCNKPTKFKNIYYGYNKYCENKYCFYNSEEVKDKRKETCLTKYGVRNPSQCEEIKNKKENTTIKHFGGIGFKVKELNLKSKNTYKNKTGFDHPSKNPIIKQRKNEKKRNEFLLSFKDNLEKLNIELNDNYYINSIYKHKWKCKKCNNIFIQLWNYIQQGYQCPMCYPNNNTSKGQRELIEFIRSLNIEVIENCRSILNNKEIDIFIPSLKIAIEYNGLYWHSEINNCNKDYHLNKTLECENKNIRLIHIFEDEFINKKDIVKARLRQILNKNTNPKIYARKCIIKEITYKEKENFLNQFHIQGNDISKIYLGAFYNNELTSVMTFSHGNISKGNKYDPYIWELNRFCSNYNYNIIGIASKLLSYFKRNFEYKEIFSYADRRWSQGNLYYKLGFDFQSTTRPNYWYSKDGYYRIHRFNLRKTENDPKDKTEIELRLNEGYYRIWDCGNLKFVIKKELDK